MSHIHQLRKGSTPLLLLSVLADQRMYGYQIMRELENRSDGYFTMTAALLYPALHKMEKEGLVVGEWEETTGKRRRKYYRITPNGREALESRKKEWLDFAAKIGETLRISYGDTRESFV
jgi:PadR family transcriptional regulator PadR